MLIGGDSFTIDWTNQLLRGKLFLAHFFVDNHQAHGLIDVRTNDFDGLIEIESKTFKSMLASLPLHSGFRHNFCYAKIVALQLAAYQKLCFNGHFMQV